MVSKSKAKCISLANDLINDLIKVVFGIPLLYIKKSMPGGVEYDRIPEGKWKNLT